MAESQVIREDAMRKTCYATVVLFFLFAAGCSHYGALEGDYSKSYNMAKYGQILNPEASKNLEPVTGLSGQAAEAVMKKYTDSFSKSCEQGAQQSFAVVPMTPTGTTGTGQDVYGK